jgi:guanylate cyclase
MIIAGAFIFGGIYAALSIFFFLYFKVNVSIWVVVSWIAWCSAIVLVFPSLHKSVQWWGMAAGASLQIMLLTYTLILGGFEGSGYFLPLFGLSNPLVGLINLKFRQTVFWLGAYVASLWMVFFLQPYLVQPAIPATFLRFMFVVNGSLAGVFYFGIFVYFINQRNEAYRLLRLEQAKSERLLLNILPQDVALTLKNDEHVRPGYFPSASILFADVVSFTPLSANMTPTELVELLNDVFSYFDDLVEKYGLEKIKTIGDCYMVAAGVPRLQADHAQVLTRLALEIRDYVGQHEFQGKHPSFRMGINSGPVTAGVIGYKKFAYDLWGDAVNTASRMESHGTGGAIQITESTYDLIKDDFLCEPQGIISVKGKGEMSVWYVLNSRA